MTDTSVSVRTEAEEEGTTAIRVDTHLRHGVTIWADGEVDRVTITAPDVDGHGRMTILADTPQLREALRALVRVWDAEDETRCDKCGKAVHPVKLKSFDRHDWKHDDGMWRCDKGGFATVNGSMYAYDDEAARS